MVQGSAGLLLTAAAGYWVLERASAHKGRLRQVGQLVGGIIIVASLVGVACRVWCVASGMWGSCPMDGMGKRGWCPFSSKAAPSP